MGGKEQAAALCIPATLSRGRDPATPGCDPMGGFQGKAFRCLQSPPAPTPGLCWRAGPSHVFGHRFPLL